MAAARVALERAMVAARPDGMTLAAIAQIVGISRQRGRSDRRAWGVGGLPRGSSICSLRIGNAENGTS
jgi:hypothetical protein